MGDVLNSMIHIRLIQTSGLVRELGPSQCLALRLLGIETKW